MVTGEPTDGPTGVLEAQPAIATAVAVGVGSVPIGAGPAAVCTGSVFHRRSHPKVHAFAYPVSMAWIDPDRPDDLCRHHRLWSASRPAPVRFRRDDYGDDRSRTRSLGALVRDDLEPVLGHRPMGPVRMLTQLRRFGWLFNPITVYLAWDDGPEPVGAVLEVTNTPWKERHRYAVALAGQPLTARFPKVLHVSPFLDERFEYVLRVDVASALRIELDVVGPDDASVVTTVLRLDRTPASPEALRRALLRPLLPTHRVSLGIHAQAARLWAKRVPFVPHPDRQRSPRP